LRSAMPKKKKKEFSVVDTDEMSRGERIEATIDRINAQLNAGRHKSEWRPFVRRADATLNPFRLRRPTGILSLDLAIAGGWPAGGISQIAGPESAGKNALANLTLAQCQKIHGEDSAIAWCCTEYDLDKLFAQMFGVIVPMSNGEIEIENEARKRSGEPRLTKDQVKQLQRSLGTFIVINTGSSAERLEAAQELVRSNDFQIVVIDSIAALLTDQVEETPLGQFAQQSSEATLVTNFQKKLWGAYGEPRHGDVNWTTILITNQVRDNRNAAAFGRKWTVGGARALKHGKLVDVWMYKGEPIDGKVAYQTTDGDGEEVTKTREKRIGHWRKWEVAKGKAGCHDGVSGSVAYHYDTGFQIDDDLIATARDLGVIVRTGKKTYVLLDESNDVVDTITGKDALLERTHDELWSRTVYELALKRKGVTCIYKR